MPISIKDTERIEGMFEAKKFEFVYMDHYPVKEGKTYQILYTKDKKEIYLDWVGHRILPLKRVTPTIFGQYKISKKGKVKREVYLKSFTYQATIRQRRKGFISRYFAQYVFDQDETIFEIRKSDYEQETLFYKKVSLFWQLKGSKESVRMKNEEELEMADGMLTGMRYHLDPLEFYEEEMTPYEEIQEKLGRLQTGY
jgi:hypothetical protein